MNGVLSLTPATVDIEEIFNRQAGYPVDFCEVKGQEYAKRAIEVAVAGGPRMSDSRSASDLRSYLVGLSATLSDVYSNVSDFKSDFQSRVPKAVATASYLADISAVLSNLDSDFQSRVPKAVATASQVTAGVALTAAGLDAIWDEATAGHVTQGTFGELFAGVRAATAAGGGSARIKLDSGASSNDDFYVGCLCKIISGTGAGQRRWVTAYTGSTRLATLDSAWVTQPDNTSKFVIM